MLVPLGGSRVPPALRSLGAPRGGHFRRQRNSLLPFRARRGTQQPEEARDVAARLSHQLLPYAMQFVKNLVVRHRPYSFSNSSVLPTVSRVTYPGGGASR